MEDDDEEGEEEFGLPLGETNNNTGQSPEQSKALKETDSKSEPAFITPRDAVGLNIKVGEDEID